MTTEQQTLTRVRMVAHIGLEFHVCTYLRARSVAHIGNKPSEAHPANNNTAAFGLLSKPCQKHVMVLVIVRNDCHVLPLVAIHWS